MASIHDPKIHHLLQEILDCSQKHENDYTGADARKELQNAAARLSEALCTPMERIRKIMFQPHQMLAIRVAIDAGWLEALCKANSPKSAQNLAQMTGSEPLLVVRMMRILTDAGIVKQVELETYMATAVCHELIVPKVLHGVIHFFDEFWPCAINFPAWIKENGLKVPIDPENGVFKKAFGSSQWNYFKDNPERGKSFNIFMTGQREGRRNWLDIYPFRQRLLWERSTKPEDVLIVDVAGGQGHDLQNFRNRHRDVPGRLVLEDLDHVLQDVPEAHKEGIELVGYDFFTPQPIKGARAYYFRSILHDWDDESCRQILRNQISAMDVKRSRILINDHILSETKADTFSAGMDISMMVLLSGMERTMTQWHELLDSVGLKITSVHILEGGGEGLIEAALYGKGEMPLKCML